MTKVKYYVEHLQYADKTNRVQCIFKRIPTAKDIEKFNDEIKQRKESEMNGLEKFKSMVMFNMMQGPPEDEIELNLNRLRILMKTQEVLDMKLMIGQTVELDIPENKEDIHILEESNL